MSPADSNPTPPPDRADVVRIPLLSVEDMTNEQREIHDAVVSGPRGEMIGPLRAAIHSPELGRLWSQFGEYIRFRTALPPRLSELAIIVTGRRWSGQIEWWVHAKAALQAGIPQSVIHTIRDLGSPVFDDIADLEIYEFVRLLQMHGRIPSVAYEPVLKRWGVRGVVDLTAVVGYYTMVAITLNAHQLQAPCSPQPLPETDTLVVLGPGSLGPSQ